MMTHWTTSTWFRGTQVRHEGHICAGGVDKDVGMAGVASQDAGAAGGLVNVAHHMGGAFGLGMLVTVFAAAGAGTHCARDLLAHRVGAALTAATVLLLLALVVTLIARPRARRRFAEVFADQPTAL